MNTLPTGWKVEAKRDVFDTHIITAPNGWSAVVSNTDRNPACILYLLAKDLLKGPSEHDVMIALCERR